jgi:hypothetical protein
MDVMAFPSMSIILVTPTDYEALRKSVRHLRAQTVRQTLEIILVAPSAANLRLDQSEMADFHSFQVVEVGTIHATGKAMATGIRKATAPIVAYIEEHSYAEPSWAEALIRRHAEPWAGVGSAVANANPETSTSWAHLYTDFGPWVDPAELTEMVNLVSHHTAYKRAALLELDQSLDHALEPDLIVNRELRARGHRFCLEPAARLYHVNCSRLGSHFFCEYHGGRLFGAVRAHYEDWSVFRRLLYIGGMPLIPFVRLRRIIREIRRSGRQQLLIRMLPPLLVGLIAHTLGEGMGYVFGAGDAAEQRVPFELNRSQHIKDAQVPDFISTESPR